MDPKGLQGAPRARDRKRLDIGSCRHRRRRRHRHRRRRLHRHRRRLRALLLSRRSLRPPVLKQRAQTDNSR